MRLGARLASRAGQRLAGVVDLEKAGRRTTLVDTLRQQLEDPVLEIVYWRPANGDWIDQLGHPTTLRADL